MPSETASRQPPTANDLLTGGKAAVAQALNLIEDRRAESRPAIDALLDDIETASARAHVVGITGPPGVGKSTLTSALIKELRLRQKTVGVIAVDPTSKRSGGALLGDRTRIRHDTGDQGIFVRSMAAGDQLGGLARATQAAVQVMAAAFDVVIVETVGIGQSETDVEDIVDTVLFIVQPGSGDTLQFMKAGIMEIPDILVVNKADQEKLARRASLDLKGTLTYRDVGPEDWEPRVLRTSAISGMGIGELVDFLDAHMKHLSRVALAAHRAEKARRWALATYARLVGERGVEAAGGPDALTARLRDLPPASGRAYLRLLDTIDRA
jgi:LAO/AO transport system kinase